MATKEASTSSATPQRESTDDNSEHSVAIDIQEFPNWSRDITIFRVPKLLRDLEVKAYTPQLVSIGPFHYGHESCKVMQSYKESHYLKKFLRSEGGHRSSKSQTDLCTFIKNNFEDIQSKYATKEVDVEKYTEIILIDACFIFELFSLYSEGNTEDYIITTPLFCNAIKLDLLMLENQIPFSFLKKLYEECDPILNERVEDRDEESSEKCCSYFHRLKKKFSRNNSSNSNKNPTPREKEKPSFFKLCTKFFGLENCSIDEDHIKHFTDLYRKCLVHDLQKKCDNPVNLLYSATKLAKAGVDFVPSPRILEENVQVSQRYWWSMFIPCLSSCKFELPLFTIEDNTEYIVRNIIAMEQSQPAEPSFTTPFCNYITLMDKLIDDEQDIDLLVKKKIVKNNLGSNHDAKEMVNKLCQNMSVATFIFFDDCEKLNQFYSCWFNHTKAKLKRVYFKDLWTASSTIVAGLVVIFTAISAIDSLVSLLGKEPK